MQTLGDLEDKAEEGNALLEKQDLAAAHKVQFETQGPQGTIWKNGAHKNEFKILKSN